MSRGTGWNRSEWNRSEVFIGRGVIPVPHPLEQVGTGGTGPSDDNLFHHPHTPLRGGVEWNRSGVDAGPGAGAGWVRDPWFVFEVLGVPRPQPRARVRQDTGIIYTPSVADAWKHEVRAGAKLALLQRPDVAEVVPVQGRAFGVALDFRMPRPRSHYRTGKHAGKLRVVLRGVYHLGTPDKDNLEKAVLDALGTFTDLPAMVWCDDSQVVTSVSVKRYVRPGEEPGLTAAVYLLEDVTYEN